MFGLLGTMDKLFTSQTPENLKQILEKYDININHVCTIIIGEIS